MFLAQLQEPRQRTYSLYHKLYVQRCMLKPQPPCARVEDLQGCCAPPQPSRAEGLSSSPPFRDATSFTRPSAAIAFCVRVWPGDNHSSATRSEYRELLPKSRLITAFRHKHQWECPALRSQWINSQTGFLNNLLKKIPPQKKIIP